jgi:adenosylhomocysteine nucleosidase
MIDRFKPQAVINTGSAGGIDPTLHFGDIVISEALVYHDVDVTAFGYKPGQLPGQPELYKASRDLIDVAEKAINELKAEGALDIGNHLHGLIASGDVFMHQTERINAVRENFPGVKAVEMEGAAIAHSCHLFGVPVLVIRALSDIAGEESPMKFEEFIPLASRNSAKLVQRIVKYL